MDQNFPETLLRMEQQLEAFERSFSDRWEQSELSREALVASEGRAAAILEQAHQLATQQSDKMKALQETFRDKSAMTLDAMAVMKQSIDVLQQQNQALLAVASSGDQDAAQTLVAALKELVDDRHPE